MNKAIEFHDSELVAVSFNGRDALISLSPVYIHVSAGTPGVDSGSVWLQSATLTIATASISSVAPLPASVANGSLRVRDQLHENCIPASGTFEGPVVLHLIFDSLESLTVRGEHLTIELNGEPFHIEDFKP